MSGRMIRSMVSAADAYGDRQCKGAGIERLAFDPEIATEVEAHGLLPLGLTSPSSGLQHMSSEDVSALGVRLFEEADDTARYVHNTGSDALYTSGHAYLYRGPRISLSQGSVDFIEAEANNSMRLCLRAFPNGALELPAGTIHRLRTEVTQGVKSVAQFRRLRSDPSIASYQAAQWTAHASLVGDVLLGRGAIVLTTRHERYRPESGRYIIDMINPATRELHTLDGSVIWIRIVDTDSRTLVFAVPGTGRHHRPLLDAANNVGALSIWHYLALVQQHLYDEVPEGPSPVAGQLARAIERSDPVARKLHRSVCRMDRDRPGSFLRGMRKDHANETGDGYSTASESETSPPVGS